MSNATLYQGKLLPLNHFIVDGIYGSDTIPSIREKFGYGTLQAAFNASSGDVFFILRNVYSDSLVVNDGPPVLRLIGEKSSDTDISLLEIHRTANYTLDFININIGSLSLDNLGYTTTVKGTNSVIDTFTVVIPPGSTSPGSVIIDGNIRISSFDGSGSTGSTGAKGANEQGSPENEGYTPASSGENGGYGGVGCNLTLLNYSKVSNINVNGGAGGHGGDGGDATNSNAGNGGDGGTGGNGGSITIGSGCIVETSLINVGGTAGSAGSQGSGSGGSSGNPGNPGSAGSTSNHTFSYIPA